MHALQVYEQANTTVTLTFTNCDLSDELVHMQPALLYLWGVDRNNSTRLHDYCFQTIYGASRKPFVTVHPLKLSMPQQRQIYLDAYDNVRAMWANDSGRHVTVTAATKVEPRVTPSFDRTP